MATVLLVATLAGGVALPASTSAAPGAEQRQERIRERRARLQVELDLLEASDAEVSEALAQLEAGVAREQALLVEATTAADRARAAAAQAAASEERVRDEIWSLERAVRRSAVLDFMEGGPVGDVQALLGAEDVATATRAMQMVDAVSARDIALVEELDDAETELVIRSEQADTAVEEASARQADIGRQVGAVEGARSEQAELASALEGRIAGRLAEAAALEQLDAELAARIAAEQQALDARLGDLASNRTVAELAPDRSRTPPSLLRVEGLTVNVRIAVQVRALLLAAEADGVDLGGGGYRNPAQQVELRRAHCGTSDFAVYRMPARRCRPPTAPPGESMHERGLAIDFTYAGKLIASRDNEGFRWLRRNARHFGLRNLPSEPWHWSTNGH